MIVAVYSRYTRGNGRDHEKLVLVGRCARSISGFGH
jgi:hypothetical protein